MVYEQGLGPIKLSGFNNLTKCLSFNLYDFCITLNEEQRAQYIDYIDEVYNADKIVAISKKVCDIIHANILNISKHDYDPVGASSMVLMSDLMKEHAPQVSIHLDKSHITAHTYPDAGDPNGICSFRVDIDIATCGEIIPLKAINHFFEAFEGDVVHIDYVIRGYTRLEDGKKIYNDHFFNSIQDFIDPKILADYKFRSDINMEYVNTWQTKLLVKEFGPERYLLNAADVNHSDVPRKMELLSAEMKEVYHMIR